MLVIEILEGRNTPIARNVNTKKGPQTFFHVDAYAHLGGAFPVQFRLPAQSSTHIFSPGHYQLSPESFKVGQYGDLEIDRFNMALVPLPQGHKEKAA